jgi:hypothetical protein
MAALRKSPIEQPSAPAPSVAPALRIGGLTVLVFACAAVLVAWITLRPSLILIGAMVAFLMMLLIGMPLLLASIGDAAESSDH